MKRLLSSTAVLLFAVFLFLTTANAQTANDSIRKLTNLIKVDYFNLYDYSKMGDTVITDIGSLNFNNEFKKGNAPAFAKREITVNDGQLKKVFIIDTNSGRTIKYVYRKKGLVKTILGTCQATNAPHFY